MEGTVTAAELRSRAWRALSAPGAYGTFVLGSIALSVALFAAALLFAGGSVGGSAGLAMACGIGQGSPALYVLSFAGSAALVFGILYLVSFSWWSQTAMGMAAMRGGLRFAHAFSGWGNGWRMASLLLWQSTFITLWLLLLVVPGIRAAFSYALAPYLLIDHPDWTPRQCIAESRRLMEGHRWRLFCLGFSFIGWFLLVGVVSLVPVVGNFAQFFFTPYIQTSFAAFYEDLLDRGDREGQGGGMGA